MFRHPPDPCRTPNHFGPLIPSPPKIVIVASAVFPSFLFWPNQCVILPSVHHQAAQASSSKPTSHTPIEPPPNPMSSSHGAQDSSLQQNWRGIKVEHGDEGHFRRETWPLGTHTGIGGNADAGGLVGLPANYVTRENGVEFGGEGCANPSTQYAELSAQAAHGAATEAPLVASSVSSMAGPTARAISDIEEYSRDPQMGPGSGSQATHLVELPHRPTRRGSEAFYQHSLYQQRQGFATETLVQSPQALSPQHHNPTFYNFRPMSIPLTPETQPFLNFSNPEQRAVPLGSADTAPWTFSGPPSVATPPRQGEPWFRTDTQAEKPYICISCEKGFLRRADCIRHTKIHSGERNFACTWPGCTKAFIQRCALNIHIRTHTGERPFACDFKTCVRSFSDQSSLTRHRRIHNGQRPFPCPFPSCPRSFGRKLARNKHVEFNHPELDLSTLDDSDSESTPRTQSRSRRTSAAASVPNTTSPDATSSSATSVSASPGQPHAPAQAILFLDRNNSQSDDSQVGSFKLPSPIVASRELQGPPTRLLPHPQLQQLERSPRTHTSPELPVTPLYSPHPGNLPQIMFSPNLALGVSPGGGLQGQQGAMGGAGNGMAGTGMGGSDGMVHVRPRMMVPPHEVMPPHEAISFTSAPTFTSMDFYQAPEMRQNLDLMFRYHPMLTGTGVIFPTLV
ncbi:hypothetical protein M427DRAFT_405515 [Gonapodya prolifera JEL478]|uniref:C2H2-type domain-containing protein n=1 Tax=Gonapodya prolifera (strain JEL478) TaxID=1344416 RepID=A0A139AU61_GONPJ|nr:hypothetical protein M427DRAFT_405515 [Gonapodya prolifera JEL478]|eukprot:KXS20247.1 hypothetical protein M427DRAFT_405515 [Gonapodya prolifera JEL478]